jgi:hypothetical protein
MAALSFLAFLWFGSRDNTSWRRIALGGWMTRAIAISSLAIRTGASLQEIVATAMLAALALECAKVPLQDIAPFSMLRNGNSGPLQLSYLLLRWMGREWIQWVVPSLSLLLLMVGTAIQFSSTILLSDLGLVAIPGRLSVTSLSTNFDYMLATGGRSIPIILGTTSWTQRAPFYPTFAEYSEPPVYGEDGIVDTGMTLRAFMPFADEESRSSIYNFTGKTTVLDTRVICMRPEFTDISLDLSVDSYPALVGNVLPSSNLSQIALMGLGGGNPFGCTLSPLNGWPLVLCQPNEVQVGAVKDNFTVNWAGELISPFRPPADARPSITSGIGKYGTTYLAVNITNHSPQWINTTSYGMNKTLPATSEAPDSEWMVFTFGPLYDPLVTVSVSICYSSWDAADLNITALGSAAGLSEPNRTYTYANGFGLIELRKQLGQMTPRGDWSQSHSERGILTLQKRDSWLPGDGEASTPAYPGFTDDELPYLNGFARMAGLYGSLVSNDNFSAKFDNEIDPVYTLTHPDRSVMYLLTPDLVIQALVQEILQSGGGLAFMVQSLITVLSSITYYQQLPAFNQVNDISLEQYTQVTSPSKFAGFVSVASIVVFHEALVVVICLLFFTMTSVSSLGTAWQAAAQIRGPAVDKYVNNAAFLRDSKVREQMKRDGVDKKLYRIRMTVDRRRTEVVD